MSLAVLALHSVRVCASCFALAYLLGSAPAAQSFLPTEDARTDISQFNTNFASGELGIDIGNTSTSQDFERSFLRFVVTGIDPAMIDCVTLELTESSSPGDMHFEVRAPSTSWSENTLTWANQPGGVGPRVGAWIGPVVGDGEVIQVSLDAGHFAAGDGVYDFMLVESDSGRASGLKFYSREGASPPRLIFGCAGMGARAGFAVQFRDGAVPFTPTFKPFLPSDVSSVLWDFGDGTTSTDLLPSHTYTTPGRYDVRLTATMPAGMVSYKRDDLILAYPADQAVGSVLSVKEIGPSTPGGMDLNLNDGDLFGRAIGAIGDLNGDGNTDLIVGAVGDDDAGDRAGAAYILVLNAQGDINGVRKITEGMSGFTGDLDINDCFGREVVPIGDWDGDGIPDVAVGANRDDDDGFNAGAIYVLFLDASGMVKTTTKINATNGAPIGFNVDDEFGRGIARLEDMDGDGVPELAVGSINNSDGGNRYGCVWILYMRADASVKSAVKIVPGVGALDLPFKPNGGGRLWFGMSVSSLGDVDGNGVTDIIVGALLENARSSASGAAFTVLLNADGSVKDAHLINADFGGLSPGEITSDDELGGSCAGIGDLDGDGVPDCAIGAIRDDDNVTGSTDVFADYGAIYVCLLNADGSLKGYQKISATRGGLMEDVNAEDRIGEGLAGIGDWDGDGSVDLLVGSRFDDTAGPNQGTIFIYSLDSGPPVAGFDASRQFGKAPMQVTFNDTTSGIATSWLWSFGDGNFSSLPSPIHTYAAPGTYDVSLTVMGPGGNDTLVQPGFINIRPPGFNIDLIGSGLNPVGSLQLLEGDASLGGSMTLGVDNPLGTQAIGSQTFVTITHALNATLEAGSRLPGFGMDGGDGELLISHTSAPILELMGSPWAGAGMPSKIKFDIPKDPSLAGLTVYVQGRIVDHSLGAPIPISLTQAMAITLIP